jgi:hypothetical protein
MYLIQKRAIYATLAAQPSLVITPNTLIDIPKIRDLAAQLALSLSFITPNKLIRK